MALVARAASLRTGYQPILITKSPSLRPEKRQLALDPYPGRLSLHHGESEDRLVLLNNAATGLNGRSLAYPRGRVLGGCSSINGMIYMRGQKDDYESWGEGWSWEDVLTYYKRSENYHRGADDYHSDQGEMLVQEQRLKWEVLETFKKVCEESGFNDKPDFNRGDNSGVGYFEVTQKKGVRCRSARSCTR